MAKKNKLHEPERGKDGLVIGHNVDGVSMFKCVNCGGLFPTEPNSFDFGDGCKYE